MGAAAEVRRHAVAFDADRDVEWLFAEAGRADDDVATAVEVVVGIGEEPVKAALAAEVKLPPLVLVVRGGFAADPEPDKRAAASRADH